ncbi:zinc-ribbon domain-containing protein [Cognatishimia sp. WU-CL00825]|uniref:zinc-ribbon domain-containing protein n=1 Tax=Cognatishimia sp. WU-CL00825 TaxID=3127658 RepID=UPI00310795BA
MRLTCPNCSAQYEVPEDVIPAEGRDVECSSCNVTWFQAHPDSVPDHETQDQASSADPEWVPEVDASVEIEEVSDHEAAEDPDDPEPTPLEAPADKPEGIVSMAADATDQALAAAVKEAVRRAVPQQFAADDSSQDEANEAENLPDFENELNAWLDGGTDPVEQSADYEQELAETAAALTAEQDLSLEFAEPVAEPAPENSETHQDGVDADRDDAKVETDAPAMAKQRRSLDPAIADVLREEAALEAEIRAEENGIESQPDLGLIAPVDEGARRARQSRERMAQLKGMSVEEAETPVKPVPPNSRRDLLPDIEEINSTLRSTEDRSPSESPDGRRTANQRRAGGNRIGFALAILLVAAAAYVYTKPDTVTGAIPQTEPFVTGYVNAVDNGRLALDQQMTKLMHWLDGMSSDSADLSTEGPAEDSSSAE